MRSVKRKASIVGGALIVAAVVSTVTRAYAQAIFNPAQAERSPFAGKKNSRWSKMPKSLLAAAVAAALSLGLASAHAQLLYSFESGDSPNSTDGFVPNGITPIQTTTGATVGVGALECISSGEYEGTYTQGDLPALLSNPALTGFTVDVTISPNDLAPSGTDAYADLGLGLFIYNAAEEEFGDPFIAPTSDWVNIDLATGTYLSLSIPLIGDDPDTGNPISYPDLLADGWAVGGFNIVDDSSAPQTFFVDNIQGVVPEPASIGVGVVSGLLMLARRRRKA
jgi:hypothetical protein